MPEGSLAQDYWELRCMEAAEPADQRVGTVLQRRILPEAGQPMPGARALRRAVGSESSDTGLTF